jgi:hypothetical protein
MADPLVLYSTNTWLAFVLAERYFRRMHWVWCSPFFRPDPSYPGGMPPSAIPGEIYDRLWDDVSRGDRHSGWIAKNRTGLIKAAETKEADGVITARRKAEILSVVNNAALQDFKPLVYVIPFGRVRRIAREVPPNERAHALSVEYIIEKLPRRLFDVLEIRA